jgi:glycosyltransferase involved in cell wall biosynthesis
MQTLHIVGRFDSAQPGAENGLAELATQLMPHMPVKLWSDSPAHPKYAPLGVQTIALFGGRVPRGGTLLWAGTHMRFLPWLAHTRFDRVVLFYNLAQHAELFDQVAHLQGVLGREVEILYAGSGLRLSVGLPGLVDYSPVDVSRYTPKVHVDTPHAVVGRMSRDIPEKFHADDPALFAAICAQGCKVRMMGALNQQSRYEGRPAVELLRYGGETMEGFNASLDIFFYRTGEWMETYGRVVPEAMAAGLPVVVAQNCGAAELIEQGVTGFVVQDNGQAYAAIMRLARDTALRKDMGQAARKAVEAHEAAGLRRRLAFFVRD